MRAQARGNNSLRSAKYTSRQQYSTFHEYRNISDPLDIRDETRKPGKACQGWIYAKGKGFPGATQSAKQHFSLERTKE
jgi:hypothetical protein